MATQVNGPVKSIIGAPSALNFSTSHSIPPVVPDTTTAQAYTRYGSGVKSNMSSAAIMATCASGISTKLLSRDNNAVCPKDSHINGSV